MNALIVVNTSYSLTNGESRLMISLEVKCLSGLSSSTTLSRERGEGGRGGGERGGGGERERRGERIIIRLNITEHF